MEVAQTSPYSHGLWNIKQNWRLYHRAGKADQVKTQQETSHQSQRSREHKGKAASDAKGNITEMVCRFFILNYQSRIKAK